MLIEVIKFTEDRGVSRIPMDDYRILPYDEEGTLKVFRLLKTLGAYDLVIMSVDLKSCVINYSNSTVKFPFSGRKAHITELIFEKNNAYCDIYKEEKVTYEDFL